MLECRTNRGKTPCLMHDPAPMRPNGQSEKSQNVASKKTEFCRQTILQWVDISMHQILWACIRSVSGQTDSCAQLVHFTITCSSIRIQHHPHKCTIRDGMRMTYIQVSAARNTHPGIIVVICVLNRSPVHWKWNTLLTFDSHSSVLNVDKRYYNELILACIRSYEHV